MTMNSGEHTEATLAELTGDQREEAVARFAVLKPYLDDGLSLAQAASDAGVPVRTARRWLAKYRAKGMPGLARSARSDAGQRKLTSASCASMN